MIEIRFHGRGGQGAKSAAQLVAESALDDGKYIQAFPEYGPERSGAPMKTFVRISDTPIKTYQPVVNPNIVIVIDPTLLDSVDVTEGLGKDGILLVNTKYDAKSIKKKTKFGGKVYVVDATKIALETLKRNIPNIAMLGALIKITNIVDISKLKEKIKAMFLKKLGEELTKANIEALMRGYKEVRGE